MNSHYVSVSLISTSIFSHSYSLAMLLLAADFISPTLDGKFGLNESLPVIIFAYEPTGKGADLSRMRCSIIQ